MANKLLFYANVMQDKLTAAYYLMKHKLKKKNTGKVKVGFICQYIPSWNKIEPIYQLMRNDQNFETFLLCVPSNISYNNLVNQNDIENDTYNYFTEHNYDNPINTLTSENEWLDLKPLSMDYVFYPRPYNSFMPLQYTAKEVCKYSKICIVLYAYSLTKDVFPVTLNKNFCRYLYCYYAESKDAFDFYKKRFGFTYRLGMQKVMNIGTPILEGMQQKSDQIISSWKFSKNNFRVIWAPRWTTDKKLGGSNFFEFKDTMFEIANDNQNFDILFRPHPLMFDNFLKTGELSREEYEEYMNRIQNQNNMSIDDNKEYQNTFWESDVLVADVSGIIPEYLITGKPLVFCMSNMELEFIDTIKDLIKGCYVVYNEKELKTCLYQLASGEDPLKEIRDKLVKTLLIEPNQNACLNIVQTMKKRF